VLHGYGIRISVRREVLLIWGRFKTEPEEMRLYPGDPKLLSRIILHDSKASLSTDAMSWLVKQGITLVNVDYKGEALSFVGGMGEGARGHALAQIRASQNSQTRIKVARPESWHAMGSRAALTSKKNARHPANAMLNYAYRVLESSTLIAATSLGLDPYIGFLHADRKGKTSLVYDLMEPLKPVIDRKLIETVRSRPFAAADFFLHPSGVVRLNPKLARYVASEIQVEREQIASVASSQLEALKHFVRSS